MILPDKLVPLDKSILYKSIEYYRQNKIIRIENIKTYKEIEYLVLLYALNYVDWSEQDDRIVIFKLK